MRFDLTDLRVFLQVCDAGSMTAAAARCHLTLAAVSARVRQLEAATGIALLTRKARGVAATPAGEALAAHARRVLEQLAELDRDLLHARGGAAPATVVLANSSAFARPLADAVGEMLALDGTRSIRLRESHSEATVQALRSGAADLGIVSDAVQTRGLHALDAGADPLVLVAHRSHAFSGRGRVSFTDALSEPWVLWGDQTALSAHLRLRALALGGRIDARVTTPQLRGVLRLVSLRAGVTVLPQAMVDGCTGLPDLACVELEEAWAHRRLLVCMPHDKDPRHEALARLIRDHFAGARADEGRKSP